MYEVRFYRAWLKTAGLVTFQVARGESDLLIRAHRSLEHQAERLLEAARQEIQDHISEHPEFLESLAPLPIPPSATPLVRSMLEAGRRYEVGPMAAVAGAVAQHVGAGLLGLTPEIIVENGGDIFLKMDRPVTLGLYAGEESPFSGEVCLVVDPAGEAVGVCTSSGTVGHSLSFGRADAVVAIAGDAALADAAATAIGNRVRSPADVQRVLEEEKDRGLLEGLVVAAGRRIGAFGRVELSR